MTWLSRTRTTKSKRIKKVCTDAKAAERTYGREMADKIHQRIDEIGAADTVEMMIRSISDDVIHLRRIEKGNTRWIWFIRTDWYSRRMATKSK